MQYLTGDIFRRRLSSAEIIFGGDNFRHHFCQISALISAEMFSNYIKFSTLAMNVLSYLNMYDLFHSRVEQYLLLGVNFGCDGFVCLLLISSEGRRSEARLGSLSNFVRTGKNVQKPQDRVARVGRDWEI